MYRCECGLDVMSCQVDLLSDRASVVVKIPGNTSVCIFEAEYFQSANDSFSVMLDRSIKLVVSRDGLLRKHE